MATVATGAGQQPAVPDPTEHLDVLIVGAGLSGIGTACHLTRELPGARYAIIEGREKLGGTWDLFRYPGIRADSDMPTMAYSFAPWPDSRTLADGDSILEYITDAARRHGVTDRIRYGLHVLEANWSTADARWTVIAERADGERVELSCGFLMMCTGYYRYEAGYTPDFAGIERFAGTIVHPQHWPADLDCTGRKVVVIGSGATAVTLVPALSRLGAQVTMLQRSPSYILSIPGTDPLAELAARRLPLAAAERTVRWKNILVATAIYQICRRSPNVAKKLLRAGVAGKLPEGFDVDTHFKPDYEPWDQRMCFCPDGDLLDEIAAGRADVVTAGIDSFTERGLLLSDGRELEADVIVTATGLQLQALGGATLSVDGEPVVPAERYIYKGAMVSGVPNMALVFGYTNNSWTLRADLSSRYVVRLLAHMRRRGLTICTPQQPDAAAVGRQPMIALASGYVKRGISLLPSAGRDRPWRVRQNYVLDRLELRLGKIDDDVMRFASARPGVAAGEPTARAAAQPAAA